MNFAELGYDANRAAKLQTLVAFDVKLETQGNSTWLNWLGAPGYRYQVQSCMNLNSGYWNDEPTGVFVPNVATDLRWAEGADSAATAKFFRILRSDTN